MGRTLEKTAEGRKPIEDRRSEPFLVRPSSVMLHPAAMLADGTVEAFRLQAHFSAEFGSPLYGELLSRCAEDIEAGGPLARLLDGWQGKPVPDALPMRLCGAVHRLVLDGAASALAAHYPTVGGTPRWPALWNAFRELLATHAARIRPELDRQVQTNEVRRSAALLGGFLTVAAAGAPLRLLEIGCSAGLNLRWDRYRYELLACEPQTPPAADAAVVHRWGGGRAAVTVRTGWYGPTTAVAGRARVATRAGCDLAPIDVADPDQARRLESFIWADQPQRLAQLRAAMDAARRDPFRIAPRSAADWLAEQLSAPTAGLATVVFHSVMWWYLTEAERERVTALIEDAGARATPAAPLAWLRFDLFGEPRYEVQLRTWPGGEPRRLAFACPHGRWVEWVA
jgi:hypothetical protein